MTNRPNLPSTHTSLEQQQQLSTGHTKHRTETAAVQRKQHKDITTRGHIGNISTP